MKHHSPYHSYLLRLWPVEEQSQIQWRAILEHPQTYERIGFSSLQCLFAFLEDQTADISEGRRV